MAKKQTILYFGSFNPVHIGHLAIANYMLLAEPEAEMWLVVSPHNPFKEGAVLADGRQRLEMARLAVAGSGLEDRLKVCVAEFGLPQPSYTVHTLRRLWTDCPDREFSLLMGADNAAEVGKWKESAVILDRCRIFVYPRSGEAPEPTGGLSAGNFVRLAEAPLLDISSTRLREWLAEGAPVPALLPPGVYAYIVKHGLYGTAGK